MASSYCLFRYCRYFLGCYRVTELREPRPVPPLAADSRSPRVTRPVMKPGTALISRPPSHHRVAARADSGSRALQYSSRYIPTICTEYPSPGNVAVSALIPSKGPANEVSVPPIWLYMRALAAATSDGRAIDRRNGLAGVSGPPRDRRRSTPADPVPDAAGETGRSGLDTTGPSQMTTPNSRSLHR